tara:strand:+ start:3350 stop:3547 length:198 start_codon:yes stop_codon:yes gene_type:complete
MTERTKNYKCYSKVIPIVFQDHCYGFEVKLTEVNSIWSQDGRSVVTKKFFVDETNAKEYAESVRV